MADLDYKELWKQALSLLKEEIGTDEFSIWFSTVEYLKEENSVLYVSLSSVFILEHFKSKYLTRITNKLREVSGKDLTLALEVPEKAGEKSPAVRHNPAPAAAEPPAQKPAAAPPEKKKKNPQLQEEFIFDTYIVGEANQFAVNAALSIARNPGTSKIY
ncbi:MAG: DnaA/Hda family protein, partial [Treponema sp.]|nr:DnaA/Hda family protein [Treponema sp.]